MNKIDKRVITVLTIIITVSLLVIGLTSCKNKYTTTEFRLDLADVVETGYGNTVDGDSMYWAIYEDWNKDSKRCLLYMNKQTFDSLEIAVAKFNNYPIECRDSVNNIHGFTLIEDSEGLHISSIK